MKKDVFQERYTAHQARKKKCLIQIIKERHSDRIFGDKIVEEKKINDLILASTYCPSSCNRKAIYFNVIVSRDLKNLLGGVLVGGTGWIHRASHIFLIFADSNAYKAQGEIGFMPYLDAGVVIQQLYLKATDLGLKCCYANPNIRGFNKDHFKKVFGDEIFCGAFAVGY